MIVHSLRNRITIAYTLLVALMLAVGTLVASQVAFEFLMRPTFESLDASVRAARRIVADRPAFALPELEKAIVRAASRPGVSIVAIPNASLHNASSPAEAWKSLPAASLLARLGLQPVFISVNGGTIFITPSYSNVRPAIQRYLTYVVVVMLLGLLAAWFIARWTTAQVLHPLLIVTSELERFGNGDFSTRAIESENNSELGRLATAYNAAARQVSAAFEERERVAIEMRMLLGDAGHALRTPLTVVSGFLDVIDSTAYDDEGLRRRAIRSMRTETRRMRQLVEGLMALARMEHAENRRPVKIDVAVTAGAAIEQVRASRGGDIALHHSGEAVVIADATELNEAIANLVENAVKYGLETPVSVEVVDEGAAVVVRVRDGGPGVPVAERDAIFERFYRGDERGSTDGSGLGLAIVARAMQRCGGSVELECGDAGRTSFVLRIPGEGPGRPPRFP